MTKRLYNVLPALRDEGGPLACLSPSGPEKQLSPRNEGAFGREQPAGKQFNTDGSARCAGACSATHTTLVHLVLSAKTAGQAAELKEAFELYESNAVATKQKEKKDGLISEMSLGHVLRSVGQIPTDAQVKEFFVKYSKDGKV